MFKNSKKAELKKSFKKSSSCFFDPAIFFAHVRILASSTFRKKYGDAKIWSNRKFETKQFCSTAALLSLLMFE